MPLRNDLPVFIINADKGEIHETRRMINSCGLDRWRAASIGAQSISEAIQLVELTKSKATKCHCAEKG